MDHHQDDFNDVPYPDNDHLDEFLDNIHDNEPPELPQLNQVFPEFYNNVPSHIQGLEEGRYLNWHAIPYLNDDNPRDQQIGIQHHFEWRSQDNSPLQQHLRIQNHPDNNEINNELGRVQFRGVDGRIANPYNDNINRLLQPSSPPQWHRLEGGSDGEFDQDAVLEAVNQPRRAEGRVVSNPDRPPPVQEWFRPIEVVDHNNPQRRRVAPTVHSDNGTDNTTPDEDHFIHINFPATPQDTQEPQRNNEPIDLTNSSSPPPAMPPTNATKKRKHTPDNPDSTSAKVERGTKSPKARKASVEVVDLEDIEEKEEYEQFKARQQAETIKRQNEEEANKPVKLAEFQCIICMDQPTDLTVTHCGQ